MDDTTELPEQLVTLAAPPGVDDPALDPDGCPIWCDANGIEYRVASGLLSGYSPSASPRATPDGIAVIIGMPGLQALTAMGLVRKEYPDTI